MAAVVRVRVRVLMVTMARGNSGAYRSGTGGATRG